MINREKETLLKVLLETYPQLSNDDADLLSRNCQEMAFNAGETIYKESGITSNVYFINSGYVKLFREHKHGKTIILNIIPPKHFVGLISLLGSQLYDSSAKAIKPCTVVTFSETIFLEIMNRNREFSMQIVQNLCAEGLHVLNHLVDITQKQLPGRVADILLYFYKLYGTTEFVLPITRQELAEFAGTSKESFIRTLSEFKTDKIISIIDAKTISIQSLEILEKLSKYG